jgi:hypothetical protein
VGVAGHSSGAILGSAIVVGVLSILIAAGIAGSGQSWQRGKLTADGRLILRKVAPEWKDARDALLYQARMYFEQQAAIAHQQAMYLAQQQAAFGGGYNASAAPSGYWPSAPQAGNPR